MANNGFQCHHVVVRLPDGTYYDGGNGVMSKSTLLGLFPESRMEEMTEFDLKLLDQRSYGLSRNYPVCPNYSDDITSKLIESCLAQLPGNVENNDSVTSQFGRALQAKPDRALVAILSSVPGVPELWRQAHLRCTSSLNRYSICLAGGRLDNLLAAPLSEHFFQHLLFCETESDLWAAF